MGLVNEEEEDLQKNFTGSRLDFMLKTCFHSSQATGINKKRRKRKEKVLNIPVQSCEAVGEGWPEGVEREEEVESKLQQVCHHLAPH